MDCTRHIFFYVISFGSFEERLYIHRDPANCLRVSFNVSLFPLTHFRSRTPSALNNRKKSCYGKFATDK